MPRARHTGGTPVLAESASSRSLIRLHALRLAWCIRPVPYMGEGNSREASP